MRYVALLIVVALAGCSVEPPTDPTQELRDWARETGTETGLGLLIEDVVKTDSTISPLKAKAVTAKKEGELTHTYRFEYWHKDGRWVMVSADKLTTKDGRFFARKYLDDLGDDEVVKAFTP